MAREGSGVSGRLLAGRWAEGSVLLREFLRAPFRTATVVASSPALAAAMTDVVADYDAPVVVELGPGTGAFTRPIQERLGGSGRHIALEINPQLARPLARRCSAVEVVEADARDLPRTLAVRGLTSCDVVVSGLPWAAMPATAIHPPLVTVVAESLADDGVYTQFTYAWSRRLPPARRQLADLRAHFGEVQVSSVIWANFPPAFVYRCRRPLPSIHNGHDPRLRHP